MAEHRIKSQLHRECGWLTRRRLLTACISAALVFGVPVLVFGLLDYAMPLREQTAMWLALAAAAIALIFLVIRGAAVLFRRPSERGLALRVENACPELMDSLITATELLEKPQDRLNPLNKTLIDRVDKDVEKRNIHSIVAAGELSGPIIVVLCILAIGLLTAGHLMPFGRKARAQLSDTIRSKSTAFTIEPGNTEVAQGEDVAIRATIHRGPLEDVRIITTSERGVQEYRMTPMEGREFSFEMYGVDQDFRYRIVTPTLSSPEYLVHVFRRPEMEKLQITVTPPAYTRLKPAHYDELRNLVVPEQSDISIQFRGNMPLSALLLRSETAAVPFEDSEEAGFSHTVRFRVPTNTEYGIRLKDSVGHELDVGGMFRIEVIEDFAPLVRVTSPPEETSKHDKDHEVPILVEVSDDYGIGRVVLKMNVNGSGVRTVLMQEASDDKNELEKMLADVVELDGIVEYGDVITYYVEAEDKATPEPNLGRSEVRFLEIRPPKSDPEEEEGKGKGEPPKRVNVADLIVGVKNLLKRTFGLDRIRDPQKKSEELQDLVRQASDLHMSARQRFTEIKEYAKEKGFELGKFEELIDNSVRDLDRTLDLLEKGLPKEAADYEQGALANLIKIEIELEKNAKKQKGQGQGKESNQQQEVSEQDKQQQQNEKLEELSKAMRKLDRLIDRQNMLNRRMQGMKSSGEGNPESKYAEKKQKELSDEADKLRRDLEQKMPEAMRPADELKRSSDQMFQVQKRLQSNQPRSAEKHGNQALQFLERARGELEQMRKEMSKQELADAMSKLKQLQQAQKQLSEQTGKQASSGKKPSRDQARGMAGKQGDLHQQYQDLMKQLDRAGERLQDTAPEASDKLSRALQELDRKKTGSKMKRSGNALRYRQMKRAKEYQDQVLKDMDELAKDLNEARSAATELSPQEIAEMLQKTLENFEQAKKGSKGEMSGQERKELMSEIQEHLQEMSGRLKDKEMQQLAQRADGLGKGGGTKVDPEAAQILAEAARVLEKKLFEAAMRRKLKLSRIRGRQAPDAYRKLVREYFKSLSEVEN